MIKAGLIMKVHFEVYAPQLKTSEDGAPNTLFCRYRNERLQEEYGDIGTLFRDGSNIQRYFIHQENISKNLGDYICSPKETRSTAQKIFDLTLGVMIVSLVEAVFSLVKVIDSVAKLLFALVKGESKAISTAAIMILSDVMRSVKNAVKIIPIIGFLMAEYLFDPARYFSYLIIEPKALDYTENKLKMIHEELEGLDGPELADAVLMPNAHEWTHDEKCFLSSEVRRLVETLASHLDRSVDDDSIDSTHPMKALKGIIKRCIDDLEKSYEFDLTRWEAALSTSPCLFKARMTILAYLVDKHPQLMENITSIGGVDRLALIKEAIGFECEGVFVWLMSNSRLAESQRVVEGQEFNILQALMAPHRRALGSKNLRAVQSFEAMFSQMKRVSYSS